MKKKQFKAESKKLLDMMINSIYTHKEIFLREIISNASDAMDKLYYQELTEKKTGLHREDFKIHIAVDKDARTITVSDNGIGMSEEELETNLGVIAKSGSFDFKKDMASNEEKPSEEDEINIIGQFGVGFYSAFMVSDQVKVITKKFGSEEAFEWTSGGAEGYTIQPTAKNGHGTDVVIHIKEDTEEEKYSEYLQQYRIRSLIKKYSDYIAYPILMNVETEKPVGEFKEGEEPKFETVVEERTLNSMVPIWKKNKSELKDEDYNTYYKERFYDYKDPVSHIHTKVEGQVSYDALLFLPSRAPHDYYTKEFQRGLALYTNGVLIMEKCEDLLPEYFGFMKGVVDSADLSLNISREMLQHDRQLKLIEKNLEKKISAELKKLQDSHREKYMEFFKEFGVQLKFGVYDNYGMNKEKLQDLLVYPTSFDEKKFSTLKEYVLRMNEEQDKIYYACGETIDKIKALPQVEAALAKGYEIVYMTENVDEFTVQMMMGYEQKNFVNVCGADFDVSTDEEKEAIRKQNEDAKDILKIMKEALGENVNDVRFTNKLAKYPVSLASEGGLSIEMAKTLNAMPTGEKVKADLVLEINADHKVAERIKEIASDEKKLGEYAIILYDMARIISGLSVEDPAKLSELVCQLM